MPVASFNNLKRSGAYSRFVVKQRSTLTPSNSGVLALPITHDWGPFKTFVRCEDLADFVGVFGEGVNGVSNPTPGYLAAYNAFRGENADRPGAGAILVYRTGGSTAAKASRVLQNSTPAAAITLNAIYEGTRGNSLNVKNRASSQAGKNELVVLDGTLQLESFHYAPTDINDLAAQINKLSNWLRATVTLSGTALPTSDSTTFALTGGNDGTTLAAGDWTSVMTAYESKWFDAFAPYDLTDSSVITALTAWAKNLNTPVVPGAKSKRFALVIGGTLNETGTAAETRSSGIDNENVVNVGIGSYKDTRLNVTMSTSQLAPRIAGVLITRNFDAALDLAHLEDLEIVQGPSDAEILSAIDDTPGRGGVVVLSEDSGGVRIEKGVTTRVSDTTDRPKWAYSRTHYVYTMQEMERRIQREWENGEVVGLLDVNADTREDIVSRGNRVLDDFKLVGAMQRTAKVVLASDPPPSDDDPWVAIDWIGGFGRKVDQIRNSFYLS